MTLKLPRFFGQLFIAFQQEMMNSTRQDAQAADIKTILYRGQQYNLVKQMTNASAIPKRR